MFAGQRVIVTEGVRAADSPVRRLGSASFQDRRIRKLIPIYLSHNGADEETFGT